MKQWIDANKNEKVLKVKQMGGNEVKRALFNLRWAVCWMGIYC